MKIKYLMATFVAIAFSMHSVWAADNDVQKQNSARLAVLYDAYKTDKLASFVPEATDIKLLEDHIVVLNMEKDKLGGFVRRNIISGLYKAGGVTSGALFGAGLAGMGGMEAYSYFDDSHYGASQYLKEAISVIFTGYFTNSGMGLGYKADTYDKFVAGAILSVPVITLASVFGMERMFRWAYQYNQKRAERLKAIEENLKMDQEILAQLKK